MKLKKMVIVAALTVPTLGACGKADSTQSSAIKGDDSSKDKKTVFNLAEYLQTSEYNKLGEYVKTGDVIFGDLNKIGIRSNVKVETTGSSELAPARNITSQFYLNGSLYPRGVKMSDGTVLSRGGIVLKDGTQIDNIFSEAEVDPDKISDKQAKDLEISIVDIQAKAGYDVEGIQGHFRFLGDDKFAFSHKSEYSYSQNRKVGVDYPVFPGGIVKAYIGGEMGFDAKLFKRQDNAISLIFIPKMAVQSSVEAKAHVYVASAGLKGILKLLETEINSSASIGYLFDQDFVYGDISMDSAKISALDGEVFVTVAVGIDELLQNLLGKYISKPARDIWKKFSSILGFSLDKDWKYTIWNPAPVFTSKIPARGVFFTSDTSDMNSTDCRKVRDQLYTAGDVMEKVKNKADEENGDQARAQTAQANLAKTALFLNSNCGK